MNNEIVKFVSDGFDKAKAGKALEIYSAVVKIHDAGTLPQKSHYPFGWIIYYALHQAADTAIDCRKKMLARYLRLDVPRPHKLHSMILTEAIRLYKNAKALEYHQRPGDAVTFSILRFLALWNTAHLRPGDWRRKEVDGKFLSSTAEKMLTHCVDELSEGHTRKPDDTATHLSVVAPLLDRALSEYPATDSLFSQKATLLQIDGQPEEAAGFLRKAILSSPSKYHLWARLAAVVKPEENIRLHVALLHRAITSPGPDNYKGKIRLALAKAWAGAGAFPQALWELNRMRTLYEANGWHLSPDFNRTLQLIPAGTVEADPEAAYRRVAHLADEELYDALPEIEVRKNYHKNPSATPDRYGKPQPAAWRVADAEGNTYWLQPHRFNIPADLPIGTTLLIRIHEGKPVKAKLKSEK